MAQRRIDCGCTKFYWKIERFILEMSLTFWNKHNWTSKKDHYVTRVSMSVKYPIEEFTLSKQAFLLRTSWERKFSTLQPAILRLPHWQYSWEVSIALYASVLKWICVGISLCPREYSYLLVDYFLICLFVCLSNIPCHIFFPQFFYRASHPCAILSFQRK